MSFQLADANEMYLFCGRGFGKTKILAAYEARNMHSMPRCSRMLLGPNYRKMLTDLIPPLVKSWEEMGYKRDKHFVIGKSDIPKKNGWQDPYLAPERSARDFMIHWYTGASLRITSMDRKVTNNGTECDGVTTDEFKLIPEDQFNETLKTNRGNLRYFGHLPEHHSVVGVTDKYFTKKGAEWVLKKRLLANKERTDAIIRLQLELNELLATGGNPETIKRLQRLLPELRKRCVSVFEASSLENLTNLGVTYFRQMKRSMTPLEFRMSILNDDVLKIEGGFYPLLDQDRHGYFATDYGKVDNARFDFEKIEKRDCEWDTDYRHELPLEISVDWGGSINTMVVCQESGNMFKCINEFYTNDAETMHALAVKFNAYYATRPDKSVTMYYDPYGNNSRPDSKETYAQEFVRNLRELGWKVDLKDNISTNPHYHDKHLLWQKILSEEDPRYPRFKMNRDNCEYTWISMLKAPLKQGLKSGFEKDKGSEKRKGDQREATHLSDAIDIIIYAKYFNKLSSIIHWSENAIA
ncbi:MAG: hypothetical protein JSS76_08460 [Bacteroidetes bacterium]|nr:hypothetical protein [Bacteroidota bacterium]